jgi:two-component system, cell cycle sensor histidine kinase and response regulator CckA
VKIKTKILWTLLGMSVLVALVGGLAVNRLQAVAMVSITKEAEDLARVVSFLLTSGANDLSVSAQEIVAKLHQTQGRDVVLMDSNQLVLADSSPSAVGKLFVENPTGEVGATIMDRRVRTFTEVSQEHPAGMKEMVVPVEGESSKVLGAVVLEYTPIYHELMRSTNQTIKQVVLAGFASIATALLIALYAGRSIVKPLQHLTNAATGFASGRTELPISSRRKDELGELTAAFNNMVQNRLRAEEDLRRLRDELEVRVVDRTAELGKANEALREENTERKRAEETVRESEEKFRQLADNITDAFWITSPDMETLYYVSAGYQLTWGRSIESFSLVRRQWADSIIPEDRERVFAVFAELRENLSEISVEYRIARPDGAVRWIHDRGFQIRDIHGRLVRLTGIASDITERKHADEELKRRETEIRLLFDLTPAMIFFKDTENRILRVNKRCAERLGITLESIGEKGPAAAYPKDDAKFYEDDSEVIRSGSPRLGIIETVRDWKGRELWVQTDKVPVFDKDGKVIGIVVMCQDITKRKLAEEALLLLNSAVLQSKESILITDAEINFPGPRIVFANPAFTKMSGYTVEEVIGKTPRILQGPRTDKDVMCRLRQNLERGEAFEGEVVNYRKDGTEFDLEWQVAPIRNADETITHFLAMQRDISARKRLETQLVQSQKMETVGKLAGGIAHEFNSIMTAIIGQSELLLGDLPEASPLTQNVTEISKAATRAATLTRQLLAYGRKQFLQPEILDLNRLIESMEAMFFHLMGRDVDTQIRPAVGLHSVKADAGQIEQVIMNMAINAHDAMPNGGKLMLETADVTFDQESVVRYPELNHGDYVMLAITDNGIGMSADVKARVFEPFFSTKEVGQGTGLGLSTCYGIIKQSGGHISVYSEPGRGTTFKIYLPQVVQQLNVSIQRPGSPGLPRGTETILLVEDDPALLEMAASLLRRLGYTVLAAANGIEALSLKQQRNVGHVDLLFTDLVMPHMGGKELSERVRATNPYTRVLFTSAYTENAVIHQGALNQGLSLLQKPFTPSALAHKLREVLDQPNLPQLETVSSAPSQ